MSEQSLVETSVGRLSVRMIGGGPPARAEHDDGIETVNAGPLAEGSRTRLGAAEGVAYLRFFIGHSIDHPALCQ